VAELSSTANFPANGAPEAPGDDFGIMEAAGLFD
jgi:hypothetical protein